MALRKLFSDKAGATFNEQMPTVTVCVRKARKMPYKLQKFGLVVTYIDEVKGEWHMLMPDAVREAFAPCYRDYLDMAEIEVAIEKTTPHDGGS